MHVSSMSHTSYLPSYRKHPGIFTIKFIGETVLAEENRMLISEEFKHILILYLCRCSETVLISSYQVHCKRFVIQLHRKKKIQFCEILDTEYSIINLLLG